MRTTVSLLLAATIGLLAASPAVSQASSIAFIKDHDIWLAAPDGSKLHRVTTDGTEVSPYRSPSQADDGTIVAGHITSIVRLAQNGTVLSRVDPPGVRDSAGHVIDGQVIDTAVSPDGTRVAYSVVQGSCPVGWECGTRPGTGVVAAAATAPTLITSVPFGSPRWVGNARLLVTGGYLNHINLFDAQDGATLQHWFDDQDYFGDSSDLGEGTVSRDGQRVAAIHGYDGDWAGSTRRLIWFDAAADARAGSTTQPRPDAVCVTGPQAGTHAPSWSPDGARIAFQVPGGIEVSGVVPRGGQDCGTFATELVFAGATQPGWGPADVAPAPLPSPGGQTPPPGGTPGPGGPGSGGADGNGAPGNGGAGSGPGAGLRLTLPGRTKLRTLRSRGLRVRLAGAPAATRLRVRVRVSARDARRLRLPSRTIAAGRVTTDAAGAGSTTLRPGTAVWRRLRGQRTLRVWVSAGPASVKATLR